MLMEKKQADLNYEVRFQHISLPETIENCGHYL